MYIYKAEIQSGPLLEIKYYRSNRKRDKKAIVRSINKNKTSEKNKRANKIRAEQNTRRLILSNFTVGDWFARFSAPYQEFSEAEFEKEIKNFFRRIKTRVKKLNIDFKYIGYCECGKRGKNWHLHIIIENSVKDIAIDCWKWKNGINLTPLYQDGNFADLAKYIRKDVNGNKRIKTSRNLKKPTVKVTDGKKREFRKIERGEMPETPSGYHLEHDEMWVNDFTGASYYFAYMKNSRRQRNDLRRY